MLPLNYDLDGRPLYDAIADSGTACPSAGAYAASERARVGAAWGVTRERVRQIEVEMLTKLRI